MVSMPILVETQCSNLPPLSIIIIFPVLAAMGSAGEAATFPFLGQIAPPQASESKKEAFRKYLESSGVLDALTKVLVALYEEHDKPPIALEFVRKALGGPTVAEFEQLTNEKNEMVAKFDALCVEHEEACRKLNELLPVPPPPEVPPEGGEPPPEGSPPPAGPPPRPVPPAPAKQSGAAPPENAKIPPAPPPAPAKSEKPAKSAKTKT